ncbi:glycosyl hydrolase family 61-domain-containing protein [Echria macrotheca]|uniref:lytic cellulose monooxygenase (C4-dehydrogenating) n=1 Tax=Echria macrotheca TaxID=438768 RepID=A0AAJ0BHM7_9PEZI|nr:glycosyl hydrolase family 61-domain-containing protein [Echria macrotheca]
MKSTILAALTALAANEVAGHAIFQQLWVDGTDYINFVCNAGTKAVAGKCPVKAGGSVTVEMHQQPGDRKCGSEAIGGAHWGPVQVYLTKVPDAAKADGSTSWFKIFSNSWSKKGKVGDDDNWGTRDLNTCCGKMDVKIPADIPAGDYLLRAEALALHTAGSAGGAQFYVSCYQITVSGGGNASPSPLVKFPGAYSANDPGIKINIHAAVDNYVAPGPAVIAGGVDKKAGSSACAGCEATCKVGTSPTAVAPTGSKVVDTGSDSASSSGSSADTSSADTSSSAGTSSGADTSSACSAAVYQQCGGNGYTGCTTCAEGLVCKDVSAPYYSQCVPAS